MTDHSDFRTDPSVQDGASAVSEKCRRALGRYAERLQSQLAGIAGKFTAIAGASAPPAELDTEGGTSLSEAKQRNAPPSHAVGSSGRTARGLKSPNPCRPDANRCEGWHVPERSEGRGLSLRHAVSSSGRATHNHAVAPSGRATQPFKSAQRALNPCRPDASRCEGWHVPERSEGRGAPPSHAVGSSGRATHNHAVEPSGRATRGLKSLNAYGRRCGGWLVPERGEWLSLRARLVRGKPPHAQREVAPWPGPSARAILSDGRPAGVGIVRSSAGSAPARPGRRAGRTGIPRIRVARIAIHWIGFGRPRIG